MEDYLTCYYNTQDPIENLKIKVSIRKIAASTFESSGSKKDRSKREASEKWFENGQPKVWVKKFKWQEKVFGPREKSKYQRKNERRSIFGKKHRSSRLDEEYRKRLTLEEESLLNQSRDCEPIALFSYTDQDNFLPKSDITKTVCTSSSALTEMGESYVKIPKRGISNTNKYRLIPSANSIAKRVSHEESFKFMYLMANINVDITEAEVQYPKFKEYVLCRIKYNLNGLFEISPGFSEVIADDITVDGNQGRRLQTFTLTTRGGATYEYCIENCSEVLYDSSDDSCEENNTKVPLECLFNEIRSVELKNCNKEVIRWKNRCGNVLDSYPPQSVYCRIVTNIEIVSVCNFIGNRIYVQYETILHGNQFEWCSEVTKENLSTMLRGSTQTVERNKDVAHLSFPIELNYLMKLKEANEPQMILQIFSRDEWERNYVEGYGVLLLPLKPGFVDVKINTWKPFGSIRDRLKEFYIGGANQLIDSSIAGFAASNDSNLPDSFQNKFGFATVQGGIIRVRMNTAVQKQQEASEDIVSQGSESRSIAKRGVEDILSTLRKKSLLPLSSASQRSSSNRSSVASILQNLKSKQFRE